ncbi:histidine--tRNA ligase [Angelakisella massiliensis]|uniref:histidine--tRNA ligase n=1 Tax=Angelakisella massiliensis TaxID=1871018 RepID=UPI0008F813DF|nr:histidine--tRNA ligase [Angelakisella massiliensis]
MALLTTAPRGTKDILPRDSAKWQYIERTLLTTAALFGYKEMRVPTFEHTELFNRSVGETTDVVNKEMYTFQDKGGRSITLRPEGTAGMARAAIENGLLGDALPVKLSYVLSCFRYEKPQSGRFREFHQFGVEMYGATSPAADAEVIALVHEIYDTLGVEGIQVELNSIGCPTCRKRYHEALKAYFAQYTDQLCPTCLERLEKNPMRILDCKSPVCSAIAEGAPKVLDYLCEDCADHFEQVKALLTQAGISYVVNPTIVRGLDYYTRTVFECVFTDKEGNRLVCGGGGRYGGLLGELGGPDYEGIGFAMGLERLLKVMIDQGCDFPPEETCDVYIASMGDKAGLKAFQLVNLLRSDGFQAQSDLMGRSIKAQMKYANKIGAKYTIVLGDNELEQGEATLKSMYSGSTRTVPLDDRFSDAIYEEIMSTAYADLEDAMEHLEEKK